ncbi:uncharacterized protein ACOB8E_001070 isoform 4-T4 [Sarcophilus harrisii]
MKDPGPLLRPQRGTAAAAFPQRPPSAPPPRRRPSAPPTHPLCPVRPILGPFPSSLPTAAGTGRRDSKHGGDGARSPAASPGSASEGGKTHSSLPRAQLSQSSDKKLVVHHKTTWEAFPDWHHGNNPRSGIRVCETLHINEFWASILHLTRTQELTRSPTSRIPGPVSISEMRKPR